MQGRAKRALAALLSRVLPEDSFPRHDLRRRMRASFVLALATMQAGASLLFALSEWLVGHLSVAALLLVGALLPIWPGWRLRRDGDVDRWSQVFIANMFGLLGVIHLAAGGHSIGIIMALPAMLLISSMVSNVRQILFWGVIVIAILVIGNLQRQLPNHWWIDIDPLWSAASIGRVPLLLTVCLLGMSMLLRVLLDSVFVDLGATRARESEAIAQAQFDHRRFEDFSDIAADWFWETDSNLRLVYVSPAMSTHTGLRIEQVLGLHPLQIVRSRQPDAPQLRDFEGKMARGEPFCDERMFWRNDAGHTVIFRNVARPFRDANDRFLGYRGAVTNITENWRLTRELERLARTDPLTGLLNRRAFAAVLASALADVRATASVWWLLQLDLDHFKAVNDRAGHAVGDRVLLRVAELLRECGLPIDKLARIGGDEFCALVQEPDGEAVTDYADLLLAGFARLAAEFGHAVGASIGVVRLGSDDGDESRQLQAVDDACYRAKREGRGRVVLA
jgi:diguanylate cyclase (GGDEF)-like protein/PAS domain S-box-containing protein